MFGLHLLKQIDGELGKVGIALGAGVHVVLRKEKGGLVSVCGRLALVAIDAKAVVATVHGLNECRPAQLQWHEDQL